MKILKQLRNWILGVLPNTPRCTRVSVRVVQNLKLTVDSQEFLSFVQLTERVAGYALTAKLKVIVTEALFTLELTDSINPSPLTQAHAILKPMSKEDRGKKYKALAGVILSKLTGIDKDAAIDLAQTYYKGEFVVYEYLVRRAK